MCLAILKEQRMEWEAHGKFLTQIHTNSNMRKVRQTLQAENADEAEVRRRQREGHEREIANNLLQAFQGKQGVAYHARNHATVAVRSASDAALQNRRQVARRMKQAERTRDGERCAENLEAIASVRRSHDAVLATSSCQKVVSYLEADRQRKAATATEQRASQLVMRYDRLQETRDDVARIQALHDGVRHAKLQGYPYPVDSTGQPLSPNVRGLSPETTVQMD